MVMELGSTRWTANTPRPFARAPGSGMAALHESGFAVSPAGGVEMDPILVLGKGPFTVVREPVATGTVPSLVARFRYTDRGTVTQAVLDKQIKGLLDASKLRTSRATSFKAEKVTWKWEKATDGAVFYYPVVATPASMAGMRYSGNHVSLPVYEPTDAVLGQLPNEVWIYTIAVTSAQNSMTDAEAAQVLTLLKQAMVNMANTQSYANVLITLRGCPPEVFGPVPVNPLPTPVAAGFSALLLLVAYNMVAPYIGSERL